MPKFAKGGQPLGALGTKLFTQVGDGNPHLVTADPLARLARIVWTAGPTGVVVIYDNAAGAASGTQLWNAAAPSGNVALLDTPCSNGLTVSAPISTTVNLIYDGL